MNYQQTIDYLFSQYPVFQNDGASAYKPGLDRTYKLDEIFKHPHKSFKTIHVGGTNGKGSCSHAIASVLQAAGYKVGLYTSPHLVDFKERIRVNGKVISENYVIKFVRENKSNFEPIGCSFFELSMMMAFCYFRDEQVDIAIVEVGLGGKLDSTNIINPILSIVTSISKDHTQFLGETISEIATQKAGIIKRHVPIILGASNEDVIKIFEEKAKEEEAPIFLSKNINLNIAYENGKWLINIDRNRRISYSLTGFAQKENIKTILTAISILENIGYKISFYQLGHGLSNISNITGLRGRWEVLHEINPRIVCDTAHNIAGIEYIVEQLTKEQKGVNHLIIGFANDKDLSEILKIMPKEKTVYYFVNANSKRSLPAKDLFEKASKLGLNGEYYKSIYDAFYIAKKSSCDIDTIFIGGSNFVVGEFLNIFDN